MVSIVLTVYRGERYIDRALKSILGQTYDDYEILIVDEYGKDSVREKTESFKDGRIRYFTKADEGPGAAVAFGLQKSSREYVAIYEQDDYWYENKLARQVELLNRNRSVGLVSTDWCDGEEIPEEKFSALARYRYKDSDDPFELLLKENFIATSSVMMRKQAALMVEYPSMDLCKGPWDRQLWLRIANRHPIRVVREVLVWKYASSSTLFNRQNYAALQYLGWLEALRFFRDVCPEHRKMMRTNAARSAYSAGRYHLSDDDYNLFKDYVLKAASCDIRYLARQPHAYLCLLPDRMIRRLKKIKELV